jgi:hypothetical protein
LLGLGAGLGLVYLLGLPSPPVLQADHAVIEGGAGHEVELTGLACVVEQPGAVGRRQVGDQGHAVLVDQVEPRERPPEADAAADEGVTVASSPELVDFLGEVAAGVDVLAQSAVLERMGHAQIQTTQKYPHTLPEADQKNLDAVARARRRTR